MGKDKQMIDVPQDKQQHISLEVYDSDSGVFHNVEYHNIIGHQVGQTWVAVITREDETIVYKSDNINTIRVWKE